MPIFLGHTTLWKNGGRVLANIFLTRPLWQRNSGARFSTRIFGDGSLFGLLKAVSLGARYQRSPNGARAGGVVNFFRTFGFGCARSVSAPPPVRPPEPASHRPTLTRCDRQATPSPPTPTLKGSSVSAFLSFGAGRCRGIGHTLFLMKKFSAATSKAPPRTLHTPQRDFP
jgi:hypothetical protein